MTPKLSKILELPADSAEKQQVLRALDRIKDDFHGGVIIKWLTDEAMRFAGKCTNGEGPQLHRNQGAARVLGNLVDTWIESGNLLQSLLNPQEPTM